MNKLYVFLVLFTAITVNGCKQTSVPPNFLNATINGTPFSFNTVTYGQSVFGGMKEVTISARNVTGMQVDLYFVNLDTTGTISFGSPTSADITDSSWEEVALYGWVTIKSLTPTFAGTFSFTCLDSTKVINGSFSTPVQQQ